MTVPWPTPVIFNSTNYFILLSWSCLTLLALQGRRRLFKRQGEVGVTLAAPVRVQCIGFDLVMSRRERRGEGLVVALQRRDIWGMDQSALDAVTELSTIGGPQLNSVLIWSI